MIRTLRNCLGGLGSLVVCAALVACTENAEVQRPPAADPAAPAKDEPAAPKPGQLPEAEVLLAEMVTAMGGAERFAALSGYYAESTLSMGALGLAGTAKTWWTPGGFYNETDMPGVGRMRIGGTAEKVWGDDPINGLRVLAGKEAEQARWSAVLCLGHAWKKYFATAKTTGVQAEGGRKLFDVEMVSPLGDKVVLRIDAETKLPASQSFTQANPLGDMPATVRFKDFRDVEGFKIPFAQEVDASLMTAVSTTSKVELNPKTDGVQFAMPGSLDAVGPGMLVDAFKDAKAAKDEKPADAKKGADAKAGKKKKGEPAP